jgi:hypothetical protein
MDWLVTEVKTLIWEAGFFFTEEPLHGLLLHTGIGYFMEN